MNTTTTEDLAKGDVILYPHLTRTGAEFRPVTVSAIVEYPATRVLYFAEGGYGVSDRSATHEVVAPLA